MKKIFIRPQVRLMPMSGESILSGSDSYTTNPPVKAGKTNQQNAKSMSIIDLDL